MDRNWGPTFNAVQVHDCMNAHDNVVLPSKDHKRRSGSDRQDEAAALKDEREKEMEALLRTSTELLISIDG